MHDITTMLANFRTQLTPTQRRIVPYLHQGLNNTEAAEKAGCSPQTVANALKSPNVRQCLRLLMQADRLQEGPTLAQRTAMLWRIAQRNEHTKPMVSLRANEIIDKQQGVYQADDKSPSAPQINVINFKIEQKFEGGARPAPQEKEVNPEFKPTTIEVPTE
jgi:hypothetical protein